MSTPIYPRVPYAPPINGPVEDLSNVILIIADDLGKEQMQLDGVGGGGNAYPSMPTIRSIATTGARFTRFYVTPFCSPTRACVQAMRYAGRTRCGEIVEDDQDWPLAQGEFTIAELLREYAPGVYRTGYFGKDHLSNAKNGWPFSVNQQGWDYTSTTERNLVEEPLLFPTNTQYHSYYNFDIQVNGEIRRINDTYAGTWTTNTAIDWIREQGNHRFVAVVAYHLPHEPIVRPPLTHFDNLSWPCPLLQPANQSAPAATPYWKASMEALDYEVTNLLAGIPAAVLANSHIVFMSDNGSVGGLLGGEQYPDLDFYDASHGKRTCFDPGIRVPLYVKGPLLHTAPGGRVITGLVHAVDIGQLVCELCGIQDVKDYMMRRKGITLDSESILEPLATAVNTTSRETLFSEIFSTSLTQTNPALITGNRAIVGLQYKFYRQASTATGVVQMFDLIADPKELTNLTPGGVLTGLTAAQRLVYDEYNAQMAAYYASLPAFGDA